MKTGYVSAFALLLAAGCAHGQHAPAEPPSAASMHARRHTNEAREPVVANAHDTRAHDGRRGPREPVVRDGHASRDSDDPRMPPARGADDRVDVPRHHDRDHLASTGSNLPRSEDKRLRDTPAPAAAYGTEADNTRVNERDRDEVALTPMDQSEETNDREMLARIRKAVVADDSLSFTAKNVKIITRDGQVTLRGAVKSDREKMTIQRLATEEAGPKHVTNELEISN